MLAELILGIPIDALPVVLMVIIAIAVSFACFLLVQGDSCEHASAIMCYNLYMDLLALHVVETWLS